MPAAPAALAVNAAGGPGRWPGRWRWRWRDELAIALLLSALAAGCAFGDWAWRLDQLVYDLGLRLSSRPPPAGVLIVAIDDASIQAIGRWPWRRAVHATLLERLAAARPRAVALDLVLSEPDPDPAQDSLLATAMQHAAPVVLPVPWQGGAGLGPPQPLLPVEALRGVATLGAAEAPVDADGVLRCAFLYASPDGQRYPHLALALLQAGGETLPPGFPAERSAAETSAVETAAVETSAAETSAVDTSAVKTAAQDAGSGNARSDGGQRQGRFLIRYTGPPGSVEQVSYVDVLRGAVPAARLAGRTVLVGMTAQGLGDTLATPVNGRHQAMPGVEVLAQTLYTLRSGDTIRPLGDGAVAALSSAAVAALLLLFATAGQRRALPTALLSVPLALAASLLALRSGVWCSPVPYALAATLAYPLWSWRRLERAVAGLDQEIARWAAGPASSSSPASSSAPASPASPTPTAWPDQAAQGHDAITARLQALQQAGALVRQARHVLADTLAAMPTAMLVADGAARVVMANARAAALFDVEGSDELLGLDLQRLLAELATPAPVDWSAALAGLRPGDGGIAFEGRLAGAAATVGADVVDGGGDHVVHVTAVQLQGQHRLIVTLADLQPVKAAEREREEALAFVSHDLRSPASSIVLLADLQLQRGAAPVSPHLLPEVRRLALRTLELSDAFVRAAQALRQPLQRDSTTAAVLLHDALADLQPQALAAGVRLHVHVQDADGAVRLDRQLVARAVANLVSNAIKHSPRDGVVQVLASQQGGQLQLQVRDHGPGLTAAQLQRLAAGGRGLASGAARDAHGARGVGLGLLFVQRVAQRHGGQLLGAMAPGGGALFTLLLPG